MKTKINAYDHSGGLQYTSLIPLSRDVTVCRLRLAIGEPQFELYDDEEVSVYCRVDVTPIEVHLHAYPSNSQAAAARWNQIINTLLRGVTT